MEKCKKGNNFISAFGEQFFTDTQLMAAYGVVSVSCTNLNFWRKEETIVLEPHGAR